MFGAIRNVEYTDAEEIDDARIRIMVMSFAGWITLDKRQLTMQVRDQRLRRGNLKASEVIKLGQEPRMIDIQYDRVFSRATNRLVERYLGAMKPEWRHRSGSIRCDR